MPVFSSMATSKSKAVDGIESHITQKYEIQKRLGKGVSCDF